MRCWASELMAHPGGELVGPDISLEGASIDSRTIRPEQLTFPSWSSATVRTSSRQPWGRVRGGMIDLCPRVQGLVGSRPLYYSGALRGRGGNWVDGTAPQGTSADHGDGKRHLAKGEGRGFESRLPLHRSSSGSVFGSSDSGKVWLFRRVPASQLRYLSTATRGALSRADARPNRVMNCKSRSRAASADAVRPCLSVHVPMAENHRPEDGVMVHAQVVDPSSGNGLCMLSEVRYPCTRHLECSAPDA